MIFLLLFLIFDGESLATNRKGLVSHFVNMVYIGAVADVMTTDRRQNAYLSAKLISSISYLIVLLKLS